MAMKQKNVIIAVAPLRRCAVAPLRRAWIPPAGIVALLALLLWAAGPAGAQTTLIDYDADDDGLIDIATAYNLGGLHWDLNGDGVVASGDRTSYETYFPTPASGMGCPAACTGYELTANVDFDSDGSGSFDSGDNFWNLGNGWTPIGVTGGASYTGIFEGNGHTIANLFSSLGSTANTGLFRSVSGGQIRNVGLVGVNVSSAHDRLGALAGFAEGGAQIVNVYATGQVSGRSGIGGLVGTINSTGSGASITASYANVAVTATGDYAGGLAGRLFAGSITAGYATGAVTATGRNYVGGLAGRIGGTAAVTASYATGLVTGGTNSGGLLGGGVVNGTVNSYYDSGTTGQNDNIGNGEPKTAAELQTPTAYDGIYSDWNVNTDGVMGGDDPWDFGTAQHYPLLRVDFNGDGTPTCAEFGAQVCYIPPPPPAPPAPPGPPPYNPAHDHPEIYGNERYAMSVSCEVGNTWQDGAVTTATLTFDLGLYTRPIKLTLSLWDGDVFRTLQSQGLTTPELQREGQMATVEIATAPAQTRFRLDSQYGLNLVLGYADCHTDDP